MLSKTVTAAYKALDESYCTVYRNPIKATGETRVKLYGVSNVAKAKRLMRQLGAHHIDVLAGFGHGWAVSVTGYFGGTPKARKVQKPVPYPKRKAQPKPLPQFCPCCKRAL